MKPLARLTLLFCWFMLLIPISTEAKIHRIMVMGNSITYGKGSGDLLGYRDRLYLDLLNLGFHFTFVGPSGSQPYQGFFKSGAVLRDFYHSSGDMYVPNTIDVYKPSIITIHLATNDIINEEPDIHPYVIPYSKDGGQTFESSVSGELARLIALLAKWHNGTEDDFLETIFVCQIIPKRDGYFDEIIQFNNEIETLFSDIENGQVPSIPPGLIRIVDQYSGFDRETMFSDHVHPNDSGYKNMASVFVEAFKTLPWQISSGGGDLQQAFPGTELTDSLTALITDFNGVPSANVPVEFDLIEGDAELLSSKSVVTDKDGRASIKVKIGFSDTSKITAYAEGLVDSIYTFNVMTTPLKIMKVSGDNQKVLPLKPYPNVLTVKLENEYSTPASGKSIYWRQTDGDATLLSAQTVQTNAQGLATLEVMAGWADSCHIEAGFSQTTGQRVRFTLYTLPISFQPSSVSTQQGLPNTVLAEPFAVQLTDMDNQPLAGYQVSFKTQSGDAALMTDTLRLTDENGLATVGCKTGWADESVVRARLNGSDDPDVLFHIILRQHLQASGHIYYHENSKKPLSSLTVAYKIDQPDFVTTNANGLFTIDSIPRGKGLLVTPEAPLSLPFDSSSVLAYDAALVARYAVGLDSLSQIQKRAADVNGDSQINILDAMGILRYVVGFHDTTNDAIGTWQFDPQQLAFDSLETDMYTLNFNATWTGDIHDGWIQPEGTMSIDFEPEALKKTAIFGDTISIPVHITGIDVLACSFRFTYNQNEVAFAGIRNSGDCTFAAVFNELTAGIIESAAYTSTPQTGTIVPFVLQFVSHNGMEPEIEFLSGTVNTQQVGNPLISSDVKAISAPLETQLTHNYPNPFNENTVLQFSLKTDDRVVIRIYNVLGRLIKTFELSGLEAGQHELMWDGRDKHGIMVPSGIYFVEFNSGSYRKVHRIEKLR